MVIFRKVNGILEFDRVVPPAALRKVFLDSLKLLPGDILYVRTNEWWEKQEKGFSYPRAMSLQERDRCLLTITAYEHQLTGHVLLRRNEQTTPYLLPIGAARPSTSEFLDTDGKWKRV